MKKLLSALLVFAASVSFAIGGELSDFMRIHKDDQDRPVAFETATTSYTSKDGNITVDLVGVVHVGDEAYYKKFNKSFESYDVVLYELVAPKGTRPTKEHMQKSSNPIANLQGMMKDMLGFKHQMEVVDYSKENFVHADLSMEDLKKAMERNGDSPLTLFLGAALEFVRKQQMTRQNQAAQGEQMDFAEMLLDPQAKVKLRRQMAKQFEHAEAGTGLGSGLDRLILDERNKAAMAELVVQLQNQNLPAKRKIAIFYGAAHLPDLEKRLLNLEGHGFKQTGHTWNRAWDLRTELQQLEDE